MPQNKWESTYVFRHHLAPPLRGWLIPFPNRKIGGDLEVSRRSRLLLQICHVANADGGEATLFDGGGAARSEARTRCRLIGLPEGEGSVFPLA